MRLAEPVTPSGWIAFKDPATRSRLVRDLLTRISQTKTGSKAASSTATRKRMILHNAMEYACETGILTDNPLSHVRWTRPRTTTDVDPRVVINADQAHRFLAAVEADGERGRRLKAFFACMYYAALRPEEATELRRSNLTLPTEPGQWGEMRLTDARPRSGSSWTNTGEIRERVPLKHRAEGDARRVPIHPELVEILRAHLDEFGPTDPATADCSSAPTPDRSPTAPTCGCSTAPVRTAFTASRSGLTADGRFPTHSATPPCPPGCAPPATPRWWPAGPATVSRCCSRSTPRPSTAAEQESLDRIWNATRRHAR